MIEGDMKKQHAEAAASCRAKGNIVEAVMLESGAVEAVLNAIGKTGEEKINNEKLIRGLARVFAGVLMPLAAHVKTPMLRIMLSSYIIQTMTSAMEDAAGLVIEHGDDLDGRASGSAPPKGEWK